MTSKSKFIVNEYTNTCHITVTFKPFNVKSSTHIKFEVIHHLKLLKWKNIFPKGFSKEVFVIKKFKNNISWTYVIEELDGEETVETNNCFC